MMPLLAKNMIELVLAMAAVAALGTGLLIAIAAGRRRQREKLFKRLDALRDTYRPIVAAVLEGSLDYLNGLSVLSQIRGPDRDDMLERLCLEQTPRPGQVPVLRRLCEDLGLVRTWQQGLADNDGRGLLRDALRRPGGLLGQIDELRFLVRAACAENLRRIQHRASWPLLVRALDDPHGDVQKVAARALGTLAVPESLPALVKHLHAIVLEPSTKLSLRTVKAAAVSFPLDQATALAPSLNHAHPRIRFLATDIIREMVERQAGLEKDFVLSERLFSRKLAEVFLNRLPFDANADVRARSALVIAWLPEGTSRAPAGGPEFPLPSEVLLRLLDDPQWFVRLHAVRAMAKRRYAAEAPRIVRRLTDPNWRVREAGAQTLMALGREGVDQILQHVVDTDDRYSKEQIVEALEQAGLIPTLLARYAEGAGIREGQVLETLVNIGKTSYLERMLQNGVSPAVRRKFWMDFRGHPDRRVHAWAKRITGN